MAKVPYATTIDETLVKKLKYAAVDESKKANAIIEEALKDYFKKKDAKK